MIVDDLLFLLHHKEISRINTNDDELGDTILNCQGRSKATLDIESRLDLDDNTPTYVRSDCQGTWIPNE